MYSQPPSMTFFQKLRALLTRRDKILLIFFGITTIFISVLEVANISLTMGFITAITNFKALGQNSQYQQLCAWLNYQIDPIKLIVIFGVLLIIFYIFRCLTTVLYTYYLYKFSETRRHLFTYRFFHNYLSFTYGQFTAKNPATINKLIFVDATSLSGILASALNLFSEVFTVFLIYLSLVLINWKMTIALTALMGIKIVFLLKVFSKKLEQEGKKVCRFNSEAYKIYGESFRNFKLIKLLSNEQSILEKFGRANYQLTSANILNKVLTTVPRLFLETIGFVLLVGSVIYVMLRAATPEYIIPILSMYALAFYRFMPSVTRIMTSYNEIIFAKSSIDQSGELLYKTENLGTDQIQFKSNITFENISFGYQQNQPILSDISFIINKNDTIAFIGGSGTGKSTLIDLIMGFYLPKQGTFRVDGIPLNLNNLKSWRTKIGYIPQNIYLFDGTVADNIVFGRKYDKNKVIQVLKQARMYEYLQTQKGLDTLVGEGGILLSGGQMQRIAIARALYSDPEFLVLDEATSALDNETEEQIMDEFYSLEGQKTLIVVAHRLSTVLHCKKIYKLEAQNIHAVDKESLYRLHISQITTSNKNQPSLNA